MKTYVRVSYKTRCQIQAYLQAKTSVKKISELTGHHKSTIYREIKRNSHRLNGYEADLAQLRARKRYRKCRRKKALSKEQLKDIKAYLERGWSPEQIHGRLKLEGIKIASVTTIYKRVKPRENRRGELHKLLRTYKKTGAGRYRQRRSILNNGLSIKSRPRIANERRRTGDWERDTMHTKNGVQMLVCVDRKSRLMKMGIAHSRKNIEIDKLTMKLLKQTKGPIRTITNDNGGDFKGKSNLTVPVYFSEPLKPQQRGTVENTIGLLRQYIKRKTDVLSLSPKEIKNIEDKINLRPRKVLGYKTPYEIHYRKNVALAL